MSYKRSPSVVRLSVPESLRPPRKLTLGHRNNVTIEQSIPRADAVPFDPDALFEYLMGRAEREWIAATPSAMKHLFETEFGPVTDAMLADVATALEEVGMADASPQDDIRRVALVTLFVDRYTWGYATDPDALINPADVRISYADWLTSLATRVQTPFQSTTQ
jgi:hypothetical protein